MGGGLGGALEGLPNMAAKRSRYAQRFSTTDALFPLTPTLSLGERETGRQRFRQAGTPRNVLRPASLLPLPEGEGGGEGEDDARPPATSDISQLSCRYTSPCLCSAGQAVESPPELRERPVDHKRSQSMGSSLPSAASRSSCFSLAASFGLGVGSLMILSHSSSPCLGLVGGESSRPDCKARAKSRSCAFFRGGNAWEIRLISATALFIHLL